MGNEGSEYSPVDWAEHAKNEDYTESDPRLADLYSRAQYGQFKRKVLNQFDAEQLFYLAAHDPAVGSLDPTAEATKVEREDLAGRKNKLENNARRARLLLDIRQSEREIKEARDALVVTTEQSKLATLQAAALSSKTIEDAATDSNKVLQETSESSRRALEETARAGRRATIATAIIATVAVLVAPIIGSMFAHDPTVTVRIPHSAFTTTTTTEDLPPSTSVTTTP